MVVALAGIVQQPLLVIGAPVVFTLFLIAPPIGIYKHDETPVETTRAHLVATAVSADDGAHATFRIALVNDGDVTAANFRIRILVPEDIVPLPVVDRLLGQLHAGVMGRHWFTETTYTATAVTFRAGRAGEPGAIVCLPGNRVDLFDLRLPAQGAPYDEQLAYQLNGGTVNATLSDVRLQSTPLQSTPSE